MDDVSGDAGAIAGLGTAGDTGEPRLAPRLDARDAGLDEGRDDGREDASRSPACAPVVRSGVGGCVLVFGGRPRGRLVGGGRSPCATTGSSFGGCSDAVAVGGDGTTLMCMLDGSSLLAIKSTRSAVDLSFDGRCSVGVLGCDEGADGAHEDSVD